MEENEKIEKVEKLRDKTGVSIEDAKAALDSCNWDMLDALIYLEKNGKYASSSKGTYSTEGTQTVEPASTYSSRNEKSSSFGEAIGKAVKWIGNIIKKGMENFITIRKDGIDKIDIPITLFVIVFMFFNFAVLVLLIVGLFFGFRYAFTGPAFNGSNTEKVNHAFDTAGEKASEFVNDVKDGYNNK